MEKAPDAFRTISEVAQELDVPQHVLRFWESRFREIKPMKRGGGRRYYRPDDLDLLRGIRHLLYGEGYTIRGVQRLLREQGVRFVQNVWQPGAPQPVHRAVEEDEALEQPEADERVEAVRALPLGDPDDGERRALLDRPDRIDQAGIGGDVDGAGRDLLDHPGVGLRKDRVGLDAGGREEALFDRDIARPAVGGGRADRTQGDDGLRRGRRRESRHRDRQDGEQTQVLCKTLHRPPRLQSVAQLGDALQSQLFGVEWRRQIAQLLHGCHQGVQLLS